MPKDRLNSDTFVRHAANVFGSRQRQSGESHAILCRVVQANQRKCETLRSLPTFRQACRSRCFTVPVGASFRGKALKRQRIALSGSGVGVITMDANAERQALARISAYRLRVCDGAPSRPRVADAAIVTSRPR